MNIATTAATTGDGSVDSFSGAVDTAVAEVQELLASIASALPRLLIGLVVLAVFWVAARVVRRMLGRRVAASRGESVGHLISAIVSGVIVLLGVLVFLAVMFPGVNVATLVGAGGVIALAAGFAFQDLLENLMAGILLLLRRPFEDGDVVEVDGAIGTVEAITLRETRIRRFDRQQVLVPNAQVYKNAIRIQTTGDGIRSSVLVGVSYDDDLQLAEDTAVQALRDVDGVLADPAPEAFYTELGGSSITLDLRYFHPSGQHDLRRLQGEVVKAVKAAYDAEGLDIPFPIRTLDATDDVAAAMRSISGRSAGNGSSDGRTSEQSRPGGSSRPAGEGTTTRRRVVRSSSD